MPSVTCLPGLVDERQLRRHPVAQVLDDVDVLQRRQRLLAAGGKTICFLLRRARRAIASSASERAQRTPAARRSACVIAAPPAGSAPVATASIAFSIGMWATPFARSTQP